jgi:hypothetical protein
MEIGLGEYHCTNLCCSPAYNFFLTTLVRIITTRLSITADQLHDDVLGKIFRLYTDDFSSLKASSLVCRAWAMSTRPYVFENITIRPSNITTLAEILTHHPWRTVIPNVRRLEAYGAPGTTFGGCRFLDSISCHLTHFTFRDASIASFELLISTIHNIPQLQSISLLDLRFPSPSKKLLYAGRFLPPSARRFRIRNTPLYPFLAWLSAHPDFPPITHLDLGQLGDNELYLAKKLFLQVAPSLLHLILSFEFGATGHASCEEKMLFDLNPALGGWDSGLKVTPSPNIARFQQVFGIPTCGIFSLMSKLSVVHIDGFVGLHEALSTAANTAQFLAARLLSSIPGTDVKCVILGLGVSSAEQLCRYNINWPFFDEIFACDSFKVLELVEFRHVGRGNLDNIANYISTNLPLTASKNVLCFRKAEPNLDASDYA